MLELKFILPSIVTLTLLVPYGIQGLAIAASESQPVIIRFRAKVGNQTFSCSSTYRLGQPTTEQTLSDFRFYISDVAVIDSNGETVPVTLEQDGRWQYRSVALLDFENKTGACINGTVEMSDRIVGTVPKGNYTGLKFTLGIPLALNHEDSTLAPSPLNLTGLWWSWLFGYKFARIDLQSPTLVRSNLEKTEQTLEEKSIGFPIHLGSTGCLEDLAREQPITCSNSNRTTVVLLDFDPMKHLVVADLEKLVVTSDLNQNHPKTAPGCMSEPNDKDCVGIMRNLGLPFMNQPATPQTFFRIEQQDETDSK